MSSSLSSTPNNNNNKPVGERAQRPGAVSIASEEAARLDQRIAEKRAGGGTNTNTTTKATTTTNYAVSTAKSKSSSSSSAGFDRLNQIEQEIRQKQRDEVSFAAASHPGAVQHRPDEHHDHHSILSSDKQAMNKKDRVVFDQRQPDTLEEKNTSSSRNNDNNNNDDVLMRLEERIQAKMRGEATPTYEDQRTESSESAITTARNKLYDDDDVVYAAAAVEEEEEGKKKEQYPNDDNDIYQYDNEKSVVTSASSKAYDDRSTKKPGGGGGSTLTITETKDPTSKTNKKGSPEQALLLGDGHSGLDHHHNGQPDSDLEFGVYGLDDDDKNLAVAVVVEEEDDAYIPAAVEYDPDAKPAIYQGRRFRYYACLAVVVLAVAAVGVILAIFFARDGSTPPQEVPYRETLGIRDRVELLIGSELLQDTQSAYRKALEWITHDDPIQALPEDDGFLQRYLATYFYFASSINGPWASCNPPKTNETDDCIFERYKYNWLLQGEFEGSRWLSSQPVCTWVGVHCDERGEVYKLELGGMNTTGLFPEGLKYFPFLEQILLPLEGFSGRLPADLFWDHKNLFELTLASNQLTGGIPVKWWSTVRTPLDLELGNNQLEDSISAEIGGVLDTKFFSCHTNSFNGTIPTEIGNLRSIRNLNLYQNQFTGTIPTTLGNLQILGNLWLDGNQLSGTIPTEIGQMEGLSEIHLHDNELLSGNIPPELYRLTKLFEIDLSRGNFSGTISTRIGKLTFLRAVYLNDNHFEGEIPPEIAELTSLQVMWVHGNDFGGTMPGCSVLKVDELQADCLPDADTNAVEIECDCCSKCCNGVGERCRAP